MGCTRRILDALKGLGPLKSSLLNSGIQAATGAIGAAIFKIGYSDYSATEAASMGAIGGAILGLLNIGPVGDLIVDGKLKSKEDEAVLAALIDSVLSGLIGYDIMNKYDATQTVMNSGETALSFLVGSPIIFISVLLIIAALPRLAALPRPAAQPRNNVAEIGVDVENPQEQPPPPYEPPVAPSAPALSVEDKPRFTS